MAKQAVYDYSTTASSNSDFDGTDSSGATGKVKDGDNYARSIASHIKGFANDLGGINTVAGTGDAITITLSAAPSALVDGMRLTFNASAANTTNVTLNVTPAGGAAFGSKKVLKWAAGVETALSANDIPAANALIELIYDTARDTAAGAWMLLGTSVAAATTSASGIVNLSQLSGPINLSLAASVGSSALTIALKGVDGNDPSASNPVYIPFRNVTAGTGTPTWLAVTAATSLVISSGSTLGMTSGVAATVAIVAFNDAGTFRLGLINPLVLPLTDGIASSTAEGGAGAADSAGVIYTGTAVTSKAMTIIGFATVTEATAGTWATAPATLKVTTDAELDSVLPIITPWAAYTPTFTNLGTVTGISFYSRRVGGSLDIMGKFSPGTTVANEMRISFGFNGTDSNVTSSSTVVASIRKAGQWNTAGTGVNVGGVLIEQSVSYMTFGVEGAGVAGLTKQNGSAAATSGIAITLQASIPIQGW